VLEIRRDRNETTTGYEHHFRYRNVWFNFNGIRVFVSSCRYVYYGRKTTFKGGGQPKFGFVLGRISLRSSYINRNRVVFISTRFRIETFDN